jgi:hypothetical protein
MQYNLEQIFDYVGNFMQKKNKKIITAKIIDDAILHFYPFEICKHDKIRAIDNLILFRENEKLFQHIDFNQYDLYIEQIKSKYNLANHNPSKEAVVYLHSFVNN